MKIPNSIIISGVKFKVNQLDVIHDDVFGNYDLKEGVINLDKRLPEDVKIGVFFHEVLHLTSFFCETDMNEADTTRTAWSFYEVLSNNKLLKE